MLTHHNTGRKLTIVNFFSCFLKKYWEMQNVKSLQALPFSYVPKFFTPCNFASLIWSESWWMDALWGQSKSYFMQLFHCLPLFLTHILQTHWNSWIRYIMNNFMQWYTDSLLQCFIVFLLLDSLLMTLACLIINNLCCQQQMYHWSF